MSPTSYQAAPPRISRITGGEYAVKSRKRWMAQLSVDQNSAAVLQTFKLVLQTQLVLQTSDCSTLKNFFYNSAAVQFA
jgi:hypothetical protein